jgi:hypothetical protein
MGKKKTVRSAVAANGFEFVRGSYFCQVRFL